MEKQARIVVYSEKALQDIRNIYNYGIDAFSPHSAEIFILELLDKTDALNETFLLHSECRFLPTKSKMYRVLVFYAYLVIYRITKTRIEVLIIIHHSQSTKSIRKAREIKI